MINWSLDNVIGTTPWEPVSGPTINPVAPDYFNHAINQDGSLEIVCGGKPYAGALVKRVNTLVYPTAKISMLYAVSFGQSLLRSGQVIETDSKITDANGWTYDGSFQFNIGEKWMTQIGNPWRDTGKTWALSPGMWNTVRIDYVLDYAAHTITVNGMPPISAQQVGWTPTEMVTQLQLCTNGGGGFYSVSFMNVSYQGQGNP